MATANEVIKIAREELGYFEKASNKNLDSKTENAGNNNYTKYARDLDNIKGFYNGKKNGYFWCACFVDWCFVKAFGTKRAREITFHTTLGASCTYSAKQYEKNKRLFTTPMVGDEIFFGKKDGRRLVFTHTGIVVGVSNGKVTTIEGNTYAGWNVESNGDGVAEKTYTISRLPLARYGRPKYDAAPVSTEPVKTETVPDVIYQAHIGGRNGRWLGEIRGATDYAGISKQAITALKAKVDRGVLSVRVHSVNGLWYSWVANNDPKQDGYAGVFGRNIDCVQMWLEGAQGYDVEYRVSPIGKNYLSWIRSFNTVNSMGYAGIYGKAIDRIQVRIVKK